MRNFYQTLGVSRSATEGQIKQAYRRLARQYHPDRNHCGDPEEAAKQFQIVQEAYETLIDPSKRQRYDRKQFGAAMGFEHPRRSGVRCLDGDAIIENAGRLAKTARRFIAGLLDKR